MIGESWRCRILDYFSRHKNPAGRKLVYYTGVRKGNPRLHRRICRRDLEAVQNPPDRPGSINRLEMIIALTEPL